MVDGNLEEARKNRERIAELQCKGAVGEKPKPSQFKQPLFESAIAEPTMVVPDKTKPTPQKETNAKMKPCPKCGFELNDYTQRCSNCGVKDPHNIGYNFDTKPISKPKEETKARGQSRIGSRYSKTQRLIPQALGLRKQGTSARQIAKQTGLSKTTVRSILPPFDKHITPKARIVLDECLAHSLELFTKEYHNNLGDDRYKWDAFIETQCEFLNPTELKNQMSAWTRQLIPVGDNAFVRGAIYALNKARDYFNSVKDLEPPME